MRQNIFAVILAPKARMTVGVATVSAIKNGAETAPLDDALMAKVLSAESG